MLECCLKFVTRILWEHWLGRFALLEDYRATAIECDIGPEMQ